MFDSSAMVILLDSSISMHLSMTSLISAESYDLNLLLGIGKDKLCLSSCSVRQLENGV